MEVINNARKIKEIIEIYAARTGNGKDYYENFLAGKHQHMLYRLSPERYVLFDEVEMPDNPRQEWKPHGI